MEFLNKIILGDCIEGIKQMPDSSVDCCISSPPYWGLRLYSDEAVIFSPDLSKEDRENILKELNERGIDARFKR